MLHGARCSLRYLGHVLPPFSESNKFSSRSHAIFVLTVIQRDIIEHVVRHSQVRSERLFILIFLRSSRPPPSFGTSLFRVLEVRAHVYATGTKCATQHSIQRIANGFASP